MALHCDAESWPRKTEFSSTLLCKLQNSRMKDLHCIFFSVALRPNVGHDLLLLEVSKSHSKTHDTRHYSSGRVISSSQRPIPDNTQHSPQTDYHAADGIRTHSPSNGTASDPRLRQRGHWDRTSTYNILSFLDVLWMKYCETPPSLLTSLLTDWLTDFLPSLLTYLCKTGTVFTETKTVNTTHDFTYFQQIVIQQHVYTDLVLIQAFFYHKKYKYFYLSWRHIPEDDQDLSKRVAWATVCWKNVTSSIDESTVILTW